VRHDCYNNTVGATARLLFIHKRQGEIWNTRITQHNIHINNIIIIISILVINIGVVIGSVNDWKQVLTIDPRSIRDEREGNRDSVWIHNRGKTEWMQSRGLIKGSGGG